ncbi:MAG TPA: hypothetical protein ENK08_09715, partial [Chloroflexi bacterium]|nr:hypothetical protein [Chloroflexota bacterium]
MLTNSFSNGFTPYLRWGVVVFFALFLVSSLLYFYFLRRVRLARYYVLRERARRAGGRWLTIAVVSLVLGLVSLYLYRQAPVLTPPVPPGAVTASIGEAVSSPPEGTPSPSPTPTPRLSPTPTPTPSPSPTP